MSPAEREAAVALITRKTAILSRERLVHLLVSYIQPAVLAVYLDRICADIAKGEPE